MSGSAEALLAPGGGPYQVGIVVPELEPAVEAFIAVSGRGPFQVFTYDRSALLRESTLRGEDAPYACRVAIDAGSPQVEYIEPLVGGVSIVSEHVEQHGYGLHHLGFKVADLAASIAAMEDAGFGVVQDLGGWGLDGDGRAVFFDTFDRLGYWTEVVEPAARRRPPEATIPA